MSAVSVVAWLLGAVALAAINNGESFYLKYNDDNVEIYHKKSFETLTFTLKKALYKYVPLFLTLHILKLRYLLK